MSDTALRRQLVRLLNSRSAHVDFESAMADLPPALQGARAAEHLPTAWQLLEHLRLCQRDILDFSRDPEYEEPTFPDDYWPPAEVPPDGDAWEQSVQDFRDDLRAMCGLIMDPETDLFAPIPWGEGQTVLREAAVLADHNAYHVGQLVHLRRLLGAWK